MCSILNAFKTCLVAAAVSCCPWLQADNQTPDVSPILPGAELPFSVKISTAENLLGEPFVLPNGLQSYVFGVYKDKWLLMAGRSNGMHGFNNDPNNFPPRAQNRTVYVVDIKKKKIWSRDLTDPSSGLSQDQIDSLSVTSSQFYQVKSTLYISGGYGYRNLVNQYVTFDTLTAVDIPGLIKWVTHTNTRNSAVKHIRQIADPTFRVTGGAMYQLGDDEPTLLVFGQDFYGPYQEGASVQKYTKQVRRFHLLDNGKNLAVKVLQPTDEEEIFRRRDLNVVPTLRHTKKKGFVYGLAALSGVFTESGGIWTIPVNIKSKGKAVMEDPLDPTTFKQGMNNYSSAYLSLFSRKTNDMYTVLFGGLTLEYFEDGSLLQDMEIPFTDQITTVRIDRKGIYSQYIMGAEYPVILSTQSNPGNRLLFGASAYFIPAPNLEGVQYREDIFKLDRIRKKLLVGYIVGGIESTLPNTETMSDSAASPYIFEVYLIPRR